MHETLTVLLILGMFILRLGVPLAFIVIVGYLLSRLDARWQAEAQAQREANPLYQAALRALPQEPTIQEPCWQVKGCGKALRDRCAAPGESATPCWTVRFRAEGALPPICQSCPLFLTARYTTVPHMAGQMAEATVGQMGN